MRITFTPRGWNDYQAWLTADPKVLAKINQLIDDVRRSPFRGLGKPEPLKDNWSGWWSRRITDEHRLVYRLSGSGNDQTLEISQCRYHY